MTLNQQYTSFFEQLVLNNVSDLTIDDIRVALLGTGYTPDLDLHSSWADISTSEVSGTGYTTGGKAITNLSVSTDINSVLINGDDVVWTNADFSAGYAVVYDNTPTSNSDKKLILLIDFEGTEDVVDGDFTIEWSVNGIHEHTPR